MCMNTKSQKINVCVNCKNKFVIDSGDLLLYEKVGLKIPKQCFECRLKQYFAFWVFGIIAIIIYCYLNFTACMRFTHEFWYCL